MAESPKTDPLEPLLKDAQAELSRRLREACEAEERGISTESTQEVRQLEDSLLAAAVAAEQTIAVRRHMRRRETAEDRERPIPRSDGADRQGAEAVKVRGEQPITPPDVARETAAEHAPSTVVREFTDVAGRSWRAWPVTPRIATVGPTGRRFLGSFQDGWICFEALDSSARRRLPRHQPRWAELGEDELQRLLQEAISAPVRAPKPS